MRHGRLAMVVMLVAAAIAMSEPAEAGRVRCMGRIATILGTSGDDELRGTRGDDVIAARDGHDLVLGRGGNDTICGGDGSDYLRGHAGNDRINAGPGEFGDSVGGGPGDDVLNGGAGDYDDVNYESARSGVMVDLRAGTATGDGTDTLAGFDQVVGSPYDDVITGDDLPHGNPGLYGLDGDDTISAGGGEWDGIVPGNGDDTVDGGAGADYLDLIDDHFGIGLDEEAGVTVDLRQGTVTGQGTDTLAGIEHSSGTRGPDVLIGDQQDNEFSSLVDGDDTIDAGAGNDKIQPGTGNDVVDGGPGTDEIWFFFHDAPVTVDLAGGTATGDGSDTLTAVEDVVGTDNADTIIGDGGSNRIDGGGGRDAIFGGGGDDTLLGGPGRDDADGGEGSDACDAETETACEADPVFRYRIL